MLSSHECSACLSGRRTGRHEIDIGTSSSLSPPAELRGYDQVIGVEDRQGRISFSKYLRFRLGRRGGRTAWFNFFLKPFGASSFDEFWRRWNPVYGYFLYYFSYRPLRRVLPRPLAVLVTFVACGYLLHDLPAWIFARRALPPGATITFAFFAVGAIVSGAVGMDLSRRPVWVRVVTNAAYLAGCVLLMLLVLRSTIRT
jgi:hypothetical protein